MLQDTFFWISESLVSLPSRGNWHGDVAVKMLNMENDLDNEAQLSAFKLEVSRTWW
jgi:hypothetical protein